MIIEHLVILVKVVSKIREQPGHMTFVFFGMSVISSMIHVLEITLIVSISIQQRITLNFNKDN
jgi:hypothetical protein